MKDLQREILNQVASGVISAEEGAARLEAVESRTSESEPAASPLPTGIKQVTVNSRFGNTEIVGDPTVAAAVADGPHRARQEGDTMVIDQSFLSGEAAFEFNRPYARIAIPGFDTRNNRLIVRMNPSLALRTRVQAGNLRVAGVKGPVTADVQAGSCIVSGFAAPINVSVSAGNLEASGRLDGGTSSVRCQMGEVVLNLDKTSNVRLTTHTTLGEVAVQGVKDQVVGTGAGALEISCTMGDVKVAVR